MHPEWRDFKEFMHRNYPHRQEAAYEFEDTALAAKRVQELAFRSNFVNRGMKRPIIVKKPDIQLKVPPFGAPLINFKMAVQWLIFAFCFVLVGILWLL